MEQKAEYAVGPTAFSTAAERPRARIACPSRWISALSDSARRALWSNGNIPAAAFRDLVLGGPIVGTPQGAPTCDALPLHQWCLARVEWLASPS